MRQNKIPDSNASVVNAEGQSALLFVNAVGHQSVARCGADSFSESIRKSNAEHPSPGVCKK